MVSRRPFRTAQELFLAAEEAWRGVEEKDLLEAFSGHPKIGDRGILKKKFSGPHEWAEGEQSGVASSADGILNELAEGNITYESKFGFIFIICATGKSAAEMLGLLRQRLKNPRPLELRVAAAEQAKITKLRLEKLLL